MINSLRADVQFFVLRLHCPEVNSKAKDMVNCRYILQPTRNRLRLFFAWLFLQSSVFYGAAAMKTLPDRSGRLDVVMVQSIVFSGIKTEISLESDDPAYQNFQLQQNEERIEKLSQQDKLRKFCVVAGFLSVVEKGQYFMTKDTGDLTQFHAVVSWIHSFKRRSSTTTERLDPRKHQNWARIGSYNQLFAR